MMKKELGQFYTKNSSYITQGLLDIFPTNAKIIDPFAGEWDLLNLVEGVKEAYDIEPKNDLTIKQNTLLNIPDYKGKFVFTNPPYLAKNKSKDKTIFNTYKTDDLYKASIISILDCEGGIIIVPINFFSSEDFNIRKIFLNKFTIIKVNVFEEQVFEDTTYTVCAFSFIKKENKTPIDFIFFPSLKHFLVSLNEYNNFSIENNFVKELHDSKIKVFRYTKGKSNSNIYLSAIDSRKNKLNFSFKEPYLGKKSDRVFATFCFDYNFTLEQQKLIIDKANKKLNFFREKYNNLFLTNYRDFGRKRISFRLAVILLKDAIYELFNV